jgi:hypothetical protein
MEDTPSTPFAIPRYRVGLIREGAIPIKDYPTINCSKGFADVFGAMFEQYDREHFAIACIDAKHTIIGFHIIAIGTLTMALIHPREVFKTAILLSSAACALFHNLCGAPHKLCYVTFRIMWSSCKLTRLRLPETCESTVSSCT